MIAARELRIGFSLTTALLLAGCPSQFYQKPTASYVDEATKLTVAVVAAEKKITQDYAEALQRRAASDTSCDLTMSSLYVRPTTSLHWSEVIDIAELSAPSIHVIGGDLPHSCKVVLDCDKDLVFTAPVAPPQQQTRKKVFDKTSADLPTDNCRSACYSRDESFCFRALAKLYADPESQGLLSNAKTKADLLKQKLSLVQMGAYRPYAALETDQLVVILARYLKELDELSKPSSARPRANIDNLVATIDKQKKNYDAALQYFDSLTNASASTETEQASAKKSYTATHDAVVKKMDALADFATLVDEISTNYENVKALKAIFANESNQTKVDSLIDAIALDYGVVNALNRATETVNQLDAMGDMESHYRSTKTADDRYALLTLYRTAATPVTTSDLSADFARLKKSQQDLAKLLRGDWTEEQRQQWRNEALDQFKEVMLGLINVVSAFH